MLRHPILPVIYLSVLILFISRCDTTGPVPQPRNTPPKIQSVTANPSEVKPGQTTTLTVVAADDDDDQLTYTWSSTAGSFTEGESERTITWTAPDEAGTYRCKVTVSDGQEIIEEFVFINVSETAEASKMINVSATSLDFGDSETSMSFSITNNEAEPMNWNATTNRSWLSINPGAGSITTGTSQVTVQIDRTSIVDRGTLAGKINITSNAGSASIDVLLVVLKRATLRGRVYEVGTTTTLVGVLVETENVADTTGADGRFELKDIPAEKQTIKAHLHGYEDYSDELTVEEGDNVYNISLTPTGSTTTIHGQVTNSLGLPVQGARVRLDGFQAFTSATGFYTIQGIPSHAHTINVEHGEYQLFEKIIVAFQPDVEFDVVLTAVEYDAATGLQVRLAGETAPGLFNTTEVSWNALPNATSLDGYVLYRSTNGAPFERITMGVLPAQTTSYRDKNLPVDPVSPNNTEYYYQIFSRNIDGVEGSPSPIIGPIEPLEIELLLIAAGSFEMGSETGYVDESPVHTVTISRDYYLGTYEVMQGEWKAVMGYNPSWFLGNDSLAVDHVLYYDARRFIDVLNSWAGGDYYRLPTEAEWEYACRAGTTTKFSWGEDESQAGNFAWYKDNAGQLSYPPAEPQAHQVGGKRPNPWGLFDMHGNLGEWVLDRYGSDYYSRSSSTDPRGPSGGTSRVIRGGSWYSSVALLGSASRHNRPSSYTDAQTGFRLARTAH